MYYISIFTDMDFVSYNTKKEGLSMNRNTQLSIVTKDYLTAFYCILDKMTAAMTSAELNDSISHNFITQMIPHHRAAIEMSRNILKYTTSIPIQNIASGIISEQTKSIENMLAVKAKCSEIKNSEQEICLYSRRVDMIMRKMFTDMGNAAISNEINCDFMREMIPHHLGAVEMSENALKFNICQELVPILEAIISSQKKGITEMRALLRMMCC